MLKVLQQAEDNQWLAMNRSSGQSRILQSKAAFVNNHFWNCYEKEDAVVVETVATTSVRLPPRSCHSRLPDSARRIIWTTTLLAI